MVPVVDIGTFVEAVGKAGREGEGVSVLHKQPEVKDTARLVHEAICQYGFCYLSNHGVPQHVVDKLLAASKEFFELDVKVKDKYIRGKRDCHGWFPQDTERLNPKRQHGDMKESFNFSPCEDKEMPAEVPGLAQSFRDLFDACHVLSKGVLDLLGTALKLEDPGILNKYHQLCGKKGSYTTLRSVYHPLCPCKEGQIHTGEHSDYGSISLLFPDEHGGFQTLGQDGEYHDVTPVPGAALLFVGDMLQRWTADKYPATIHRMVVPAAHSGPPRQTLIFYYYPDHQALISCLDGSDAYPPVTPLDYLMTKFAETL